MTKKLSLVLFSLLLQAAIYGFVLASLALAQYGCPPYGAECPPASRLVVDKLVRDPSQSGKGGDVFVDNLTLFDYRFSPSEEIIFKIKIKNTGNIAFNQVNLQDLLPSVADFLLEDGALRSDIREINTTLYNLESGQTQEVYVRTRVKPANQIPGGIFCQEAGAVNRAIARAENQPDTEDTSSFCVENRVLGVVPEQPKAGPEMAVLAGLFGITGLGVAFKKNKLQKSAANLSGF